ncbi:TPM domain-containing protein [Cohnella sp. GCM10027633]|uniref:TPM domain-containing protein n=1 Tax=unclassified Cohnella TaxID=2636738 RepID=UPI0036315D0D
MRRAARYGGRRAGWLLLAALWLLASAAFAGESSAQTADPRYGVYVVDEANVISAETKERLYRRAAWLQEKTGSAQIGVVTVPSLEGTTLEQLAVDTFRKLGLGSSKRNDGVLLLYSAVDGHVRIEVGYGLEGRIPDGKAGAILDQYFVPNRDAARFDDAFSQTQSALIVEIAAEYGIDATGNVESVEPLRPGADGGGSWYSDMPFWMKAVLGIGVVFLIAIDFKFTGGAVTWAILSMFGRRGGGGGGRGGARGGGGSSGGGGASR